MDLLSYKIFNLKNKKREVFFLYDSALHQTQAHKHFTPFIMLSKRTHAKRPVQMGIVRNESSIKSHRYMF
jgi:hypothetical protein